MAKRMLSLLLAVALLFGAASCKQTGQHDDATVPAVTAAHSEISLENMQLELTDRDRDSSYTESTATHLSTTEEVLNITAAGTYIATGQHRQIVIHANDTAKIQLVLQNVTLNAQNEPAIYIESADKVFLTLANNSQNTLSDLAGRSSTQQNLDAVIFSKADLTINGTGSMQLTGNYKHGIVSKDDLVICDATVDVTAKNRGIEGQDCLKISNANLKVSAGGDGLSSTNTEDENRGFMVIQSGNFDIAATGDALQASTALLLKNGSFKLSSGGGCKNAVNNLNGDITNDPPQNKEKNSTPKKTDTDTESTKGLKAGTLLKIEAGTITVDSANDALHANKDVEMNGGTVSLTSGDDGIHADENVYINNGEITITNCYEGIEGSALYINGGKIDITATDDGLNAAGGTDDFSDLEKAPKARDTAANEPPKLCITGGYCCVNAMGDGLDVNGSLLISGGVILVSGASDNGNSALDYDGTAVINGGTVVCAGSSGMAQGFHESSSQCSFLYHLTDNAEKETLVAVTDEAQNIIVSYLPAKAFHCLVVSTPALQNGKSYSLVLGGSIAQADEKGFAQSGTVQNEKEKFDIKLTETATTIGSSNRKNGNMDGMPPGGSPENNKMPKGRDFQKTK